MSTEGIATDTTVSQTTETALNAADETHSAQSSDTAQGQEGEEQKAEAAKPEKTPEQREIERLRRAVDRKHRQLAEARVQLGLTRQPIEANNQAEASDSEPVTLSRAEALRLIEAEAKKLAPNLAREQAENEHLAAAGAKLRAALGEEFQELTDELASVFNGARQLDVLRADDPAAVVRYLTADENADEAEAIAKMSHFNAGRAIARIEDKIKAAAAKPQASKVPAPLEPIKGGGSANAVPNPLDTKAWIRYQNARERAARN